MRNYEVMNGEKNPDRSTDILFNEVYLYIEEVERRDLVLHAAPLC